MSAEHRPRGARGFTLIELVVYIVIVAVAVAGVLMVLDFAARTSADPLVRKQMLAIAESLLEEVETMPFTYCDPIDANAATASGASVGAGACAATVEALGPEAGEQRTNPATPFNNVNDYYVAGGYALPGPVTDVAGGNPAPAEYGATIVIVPEPLNGIASGASPAAMDVLRIAVTVSRGSEVLTLEGYRTRHSPNFTP